MGFFSDQVTRITILKASGLHYITHTEIRESSFLFKNFTHRLIDRCVYWKAHRQDPQFSLISLRVGIRGGTPPHEGFVWETVLRRLWKFWGRLSRVSRVFIKNDMDWFVRNLINDDKWERKETDWKDILENYGQPRRSLGVCVLIITEKARAKERSWKFSWLQWMSER